MSDDPLMPIAEGTEEPVIFSLRRATRDRHLALENTVALTSSVSPASYLEALRGFALFLSAWEPRIDAALDPPLRPWFATRSRRSLLEQDLARLHAGPGEPEHAARVCSQAVSRINVASVSAIFGSMYVLEGSALGGQVIARSARETLGLGPENGAAYFNGHGRHTAARWAEFRQLLEERVEEGAEARRLACEAACQTFDALIATFSCLRPAGVPT